MAFGASTVHAPVKHHPHVSVATGLFCTLATLFGCGNAGAGAASGGASGGAGAQAGTGGSPAGSGGAGPGSGGNTGGVSASGGAGGQPRTFTHPGIPLTLADLNQLKADLNTEPWKTAYAALTTDSHSQLAYVMQGPFAMVSRTPNVNLGQYGNDMQAVFNLARMWFFTGNAAYAQKARDIMIAWATTQTAWGARLQGHDGLRREHEDCAGPVDPHVDGVVGGGGEAVRRDLAGVSSGILSISGRSERGSPPSPEGRPG